DGATDNQIDVGDDHRVASRGGGEIDGVGAGVQLAQGHRDDGRVPGVGSGDGPGMPGATVQAIVDVGVAQVGGEGEVCAAGAGQGDVGEGHGSGSDAVGRRLVADVDGAG